MCTTQRCFRPQVLGRPSAELFFCLTCHSLQYMPSTRSNDYWLDTLGEKDFQDSPWLDSLCCLGIRWLRDRIEALFRLFVFEDHSRASSEHKWTWTSLNKHAPTKKSMKSCLGCQLWSWRRRAAPLSTASDLPPLNLSLTPNPSSTSFSLLIH